MQLVSTAGPPHKTKQKFVYGLLRDAIMRCELRPGQRLIIDDIARQLSVSAIPVREALQMLGSESLVEHVPHVGAIVAPISRDSVTETFTVLEGLETVAARAAAERMTPEQSDSVMSLLSKMDSALDVGEHERWGDLNTQFHGRIADITGMSLLQEMTERVLGQWDRVRRYFFRGVLLHRIAQSQQEHWEILRAMQDRDYPRLEALVKHHNRSALEAYMGYMEQNPAVHDGGGQREGGQEKT